MEEKKGMLDGLFNFLNGAWLVNEGPTKARCDAYNEQLREANEQIKREDLSPKQKRYYKKEKKRAMNGLHEVDVENKDFIAKVICGVGFGFLAFASAVHAIKGNSVPSRITMGTRKWTING